MAGKRLGVLGGTFDPVHIGHLVLAETAREQLALDRVLFVPAGQPWRKVGRKIAPVGDRVAMVRLAIAGNPAFQLSTIESTRPGPSYTAETLTEIQHAYPEAELYLILGEDAVEDMPHWKDPERIRELALIVAAPRPGQPSPHEPGQLIVLSAMPLIGVSATAIRERVRAGRSIRYLVLPVVEDYIRDHGLYRAD